MLLHNKIKNKETLSYYREREWYYFEYQKVNLCKWILKNSLRYIHTKYINKKKVGIQIYYDRYI